VKLNRRGKASIFTDSEWQRLLKATRSESQRLIWEIAYWTGERMGAIRQLRVESVYRDPIARIPHEYIFYAKETRKGQIDDRQVPIHPSLARALKAYSPPVAGYLFPGRDAMDCLDHRTIDSNLRSTLVRAGLDKRGFTTHSFRRTFLTRLANNAISPWVLQKISGHRDRSSLDEYIEVTDKQVLAAVNTL
jgi:integrase/recombinase XerD